MRLTNPLRARDAPAEVDTKVRSVDGGRSVFDIADRARGAGLAFLAMCQAGAGRRQLAAWLIGAYASATAPAGSVPRRKLDLAAGAIEPTSVERLLLDTHGRTLEMLSQARTWDPFKVGRDMIALGIVVAVGDAHGALGYAPVDQPDLRLLDRVISLFAADYLTRPGEYHALEICGSCAAVSFDLALEHEPHCDPRVVNESGIRDVLRPCKTIPGTGEGQR